MVVLHKWSLNRIKLICHSCIVYAQISTYIYNFHHNQYIKKIAPKDFLSSISAPDNHWPPSYHYRYVLADIFAHKCIFRYKFSQHFTIFSLSTYFNLIHSYEWYCRVVYQVCVHFLRDCKLHKQMYFIFPPTVLKNSIFLCLLSKIWEFKKFNFIIPMNLSI